MSTSHSPAPAAPRGARHSALWAAIAVLGVAVVALGSALYYVQTRPATEHAVAVSPVPVPVAIAPPTPPVTTPPAAPAPEPAPAPAPAPAPRKKVVAKSATPAPVASGTSGAGPVVSTEAATGKAETGAATAAAGVAAPAPKVVCADCATVTAVTPVEHEGAASGAGAVAGGVLGAIVGNQVGGGDGKTLATLLGAIGGGYAGNTVEKKMKKVTAYQVDLRMDDGSSRSLQLASPVGVGVRVRVEGNNLQPLPAGQ